MIILYWNVKHCYSNQYHTYMGRAAQSKIFIFLCHHNDFNISIHVELFNKKITSESIKGDVICEDRKFSLFIILTKLCDAVPENKKGRWRVGKKKNNTQQWFQTGGVGMKKQKLPHPLRHSNEKNSASWHLLLLCFIFPEDTFWHSSINTCIVWWQDQKSNPCFIPLCCFCSTLQWDERWLFK